MIDAGHLRDFNARLVKSHEEYEFLMEQLNGCDIGENTNETRTKIEQKLMVNLESNLELKKNYLQALKEYFKAEDQEGEEWKNV